MNIFFKKCLFTSLNNNNNAVPIKKKLILKSNLQRSILEFYRELLKFCQNKPEPTKTNLKEHIHKEFRKNIDIPKNKFNRIEYLLRAGKNQFSYFKDANVENISQTFGLKN